MAGGLALALFVPLSKSRASASYVLLSLGLSGVVFYLVHLLDTRWQVQFPVLTDWGRNPLLLYLLHYILLAVFALPPIPGWYVAAPLWARLAPASGTVVRFEWGWPLSEPAPTIFCPMKESLPEPIADNRQQADFLLILDRNNGSTTKSHTLTTVVCSGFII